MQCMMTCHVCCHIKNCMLGLKQSIMSTCLQVPAVMHFHNR